MGQPRSRRELIAGFIFIVVLTQIVKRIPAEMWWLAAVVVFAAAMLLGLINRRPFTLGSVAVAAVVAVVIGLVVRFL